MNITRQGKAIDHISVDIADGPIVTAPGTETGIFHTGQIEKYYVGNWENPNSRYMAVNAKIRPIKKDGTPSARSVRVDIPRKNLPADVMAALAELRPNIADWLTATARYEGPDPSVTDDVAAR